MRKQSGIISRLRSIGHAIDGIKTLVKEEPNMRIHALASILVIVVGIVKGLSNTQWLAITFAIASVCSLEAVNTCIELLCNKTCGTQPDPQIKIIKDIAAAAVLIAAAASLVVAALIFLPLKF